jgi:hypothetical protein
MITCKKVTGWHTDAREGALGPWARFRYRTHMLICPQCKAYAAGFDETVTRLHEMPKEAAPDEMKRRLVERLKAR